MFKKILILILCLCAPVSYARAASVEEVSQAAPSESDLKLNDQVRSALQADDSLKPALADVQIKTVNSTVNLKGTVASEKEKKAIEEKILAFPAVTHVQNYIQVSGK